MQLRRWLRARLEDRAHAAWDTYLIAAGRLDEAISCGWIPRRQIHVAAHIVQAAFRLKRRRQWPDDCHPMPEEQADYSLGFELSPHLSAPRQRPLPTPPPLPPPPTFPENALAYELAALPAMPVVDEEARTAAAHRPPDVAVHPSRPSLDTRLGSGMSVWSRGWMGSNLSVFNLVELGSSLSLRSLRLGQLHPILCSTTVSRG